jgi:hypothetical protein
MKPKAPGGQCKLHFDFTGFRKLQNDEGGEPWDSVQNRNKRLAQS